jgi:hypothetical protein
LKKTACWSQQDAREREQRFQQQVNQQQQILKRLAPPSLRKKPRTRDWKVFSTPIVNCLTERRAQLREVRANLNELLGTIQGVAGDFRGMFENSLISAQYPGRNEFLDSSSSVLPATPSRCESMKSSVSGSTCSRNWLNPVVLLVPGHV